LAETLPPALDTVAARLGRGANGLRRHFPALCCQITARYQAYQHACFLQRHSACLEEIRTIALALHAQGIFPSSTRVAAQLARPRNIASNAEDMAALRHISDANWGGSNKLDATTVTTPSSAMGSITWHCRIGSITWQSCHIMGKWTT
jgi:hypothetical protein